MAAHKRKRGHRICLAQLPETVILEILARLPVKSLLRFKSGCKSWLSMISEPIFVKTHLKYANENLRRHIVFNKWENPKTVICIDYETQDMMLLRDLPFTNLDVKPEILGSCNGLLLVGLGDAHLLWNPSTRKPIFDITVRAHFPRYQKLYGLCYDSSTDAYKIVRVIRGTSCSVDARNGYYDSTRASFYNSKTRRWTKLQCFPYKLFTSAQGMLVNKNLHYVVVRDKHNMDRQYHIGNDAINNENGGDTKEYVVIYFDVAEDKFKELPKPDWLNDECSFDMGSLGGLLCLVQHMPDGRSFKSLVWVMKQYGVGDSWTLMHTIRLKSNKFQPLYLKRNGEIMLNVETCMSHELTTYSSVGTGTAREVFKYNNETGFIASPYVESLVSPLEAEMRR